MPERAPGAGFTLVEILASMLASAVMALTAGSVLVYAYMGWARNRDAVKMQTDASLAMNVLSRDIRESAVSDIAIHSNRIDFATNAVRHVPAAVYQAGDKLIRDPGGFEVIENWLVSFGAAPTNGAQVRVTLRLRGGRGDSETAMDGVFDPRN